MFVKVSWWELVEMHNCWLRWRIDVEEFYTKFSLTPATMSECVRGSTKKLFFPCLKRNRLTNIYCLNHQCYRGTLRRIKMWYLRTVCVLFLPILKKLFTIYVICWVCTFSWFNLNANFIKYIVRVRVNIVVNKCSSYSGVSGCFTSRKVSIAWFFRYKTGFR